jgi:cyclopropane-fatty-acyl-phospholipid synthase
MSDHLEAILAQADIHINGERPWDIQVHDPAFQQRVLAGGSLALGESYMDGWWSCQALDQFCDKMVRGRINRRVIPLAAKASIIKARLLNLQTRLRSRAVAETHYDLSPALFKSFLDPYNQYTCGYFQDTDELDQAQENKLDLICRKLMLSAQDQVLDIGCGWGGFARFAAERYGCQVTGITISRRQADSAREFCKGLPVTIVESDYREFSGTLFDKVLVCGMIEHVGYKNYRSLMQVAHDCLKDDGLFLLHTIGRHTSGASSDPWLSKYIFPNSMVPSAQQLTAAAERLFALNDWHSFGVHYDPTLMAWQQNFQNNWESIPGEYDGRFYRMWNYYLLMCAGVFRSNKKQLWQLVLAKRRGAVAGYQSVR